MPYEFTPSHQVYGDPVRTFTPTPLSVPVQPTLADVVTQLVRMETRLVKLMYHAGLDANGRVRDED